MTIRTNAPLGYSVFILSPSKTDFKNSLFYAFEGGSLNSGKVAGYEPFIGNTTYVPTGIWYNQTEKGRRHKALRYDFSIGIFISIF